MCVGSVCSAIPKMSNFLSLLFHSYQITFYPLCTHAIKFLQNYFSGVCFEKQYTACNISGVQIIQSIYFGERFTFFYFLFEIMDLSLVKFKLFLHFFLDSQNIYFEFNYCKQTYTTFTS